MKAVFVEATEFTEWIVEHLTDDDYEKIQQELMRNPDAGDVMQGCGGLRKFRIGDPSRGRGKRGGARIIYLYIQEVKQFFLLDVYGKNEKDDLTADEKKELSRFANDLKKTVTSSSKPSTRGNK